MSVYNSLKNIKNKILLKNIISITGNIYEFVEIDGKLKSINDALKGIFEAAGFNSVKKFIPSKGVVDLMNPDAVDDEGEEVDEFEGLGNQGATKADYTGFISEVIDSFNNYDPNMENKVAYIFDLSDVYFADKNATLFNADLTAQIVSAYNDRINFKKSEVVDNQLPKLVFINRNDNGLSDILKIRNVEFTSVNIDIPNNNERSVFISRYGRLLEVSDDKSLIDSKSKAHADAVALTSGLSFREILQFARLSNDDSLTFREMYLLAMHNRKESEWENITINKVKDIESNIKSNLFGQDHAVKAVSDVIKKSFLGLSGITHSSESAKPKGVLFLSGPTGTGKTEIVKLLTKEIFGDESKMIRFDMSEYNHEHSDQKLIGAPPGYVGYDAGGKLTDEVKKNPFSVLLFDEIEKAHPKILDKFLQILEDGRLSSGQGELVDFSETFIVFTSNIGQSSVKDPKKETPAGVRDKFRSAVDEFFRTELNRPELLNRIGRQNIIPFNYIKDPEIITKLVENKIKMISKRLNKLHNIEFKYTKESLDDISELIYERADITMGGRGLVSMLEVMIVDNLANKIFEDYDLIQKNKNENKITYIELERKANKINLVIK